MRSGKYQLPHHSLLPFCRRSSRRQRQKHSHMLTTRKLLRPPLNRNPVCSGIRSLVFSLVNLLYVVLTPLTGKYSPAEVAQLDAAIEIYRAVSRHYSFHFGQLLSADLQGHNMSDDDIRKTILHKGHNKHSQSFWAEICMSISFM